MFKLFRKADVRLRGDIGRRQAKDFDRGIAAGKTDVVASLERQREPFGYKTQDGFRHGDPAGIAPVGDLVRKADAVAVDVVAVEDDVAMVDAEQEPDVLVGGDRGIAAHHRPLQRHRVPNRLFRGPELQDHRVAADRQQSCAVAGQHGHDQVATQRSQRRRCGDVVGLHERVEIGDTGRADGREPLVRLSRYVGLPTHHVNGARPDDARPRPSHCPFRPGRGRERRAAPTRVGDRWHRRCRESRCLRRGWSGRRCRE